MSAPDPDRARGLYPKFAVFRLPDPDADPAPSVAPYRTVTEPLFVLRYQRDPHARAALEAYAKSCEADYPILAADLRRELAEATDFDNFGPTLHTWDEDQGNGVLMGRASGGGCATCDGGGCGDCR